jgi:hypothetical protein
VNYIKSIGSTRYWIRLGQPDAIGFPLFFVALAFTTLLSFAFDAVRLQNISLVWIPINITAIACVLLFAVPILIYKRKRNTSRARQPIFNSVFMSLCFGFKNLIMLNITGLFGVDDSGDPTTRFVGGLFLGFSILTIFTNIVGSRLQREASVAQLRSSESGLRFFRENAVSNLFTESRLAAAKSISSLTPQLELLQNRVAQSQKIVTQINRIISFLRDELKPFEQILSKDADLLVRNKLNQPDTAMQEPDSKVMTFNLIRVWITVLPIPFLLFLLGSFAIPLLNGLDIIVICLTFALTLTVLKYGLRALPDVTANQAFLVTTFVATLSSLPSFYLISQIPNPAGIPELLPVFFVIPALSVIATSQAYILDQRLSRIEEQLELVVAELTRENKLYQQKVWLASHRWYLLLHGVVQPALTAASMRASGTSQVDTEVQTLILGDLQRALDSLTDPRDLDSDMELGIAEIQSAWMGLCDIDCGVEAEVLNRVSANPIAIQVINEVSKEVISNAVRHGNASSAQIKISMDGDSNLKVAVANDGSEPVEDGVVSVGSRMLDSFCLDRSLTWDNETQMTTFTAIIPISN